MRLLTAFFSSLLLEVYYRVQSFRQDKKAVNSLFRLGRLDPTFRPGSQAYPLSSQPPARVLFPLSL